MMRKIHISFETGMQGGDREDVIEVDDDATEGEIDNIVREFVFDNYCSWGWSEVAKETAATS